MQKIWILQINVTTNALDNLSPKPAAYIAYHASGERGTGRIGVCVYSSGRKTFVYRHFVGKTAKFQTLGEYPSMSISSALEKFESLSSCSDVTKLLKQSVRLQICLRSAKPILLLLVNAHTTITKLCAPPFQTANYFRVILNAFVRKLTLIHLYQEMSAEPLKGWVDNWKSQK